MHQKQTTTKKHLQNEKRRESPKDILNEIIEKHLK